MKAKSYFSISLSSIVLFAISASAYAVSELPDPTQPAYWLQQSRPVFVEQVQTPGRKIEWRVSAIRISPDDRTAIVNGKLVRVGDTVSTAVVREIQHASVVIEEDQKQLILRLFTTSSVKDDVVTKTKTSQP